MPLAKDVAAELRKLADCLDKSPNAEIVRSHVSFWHFSDNKDNFLSLAHLLPRPLKKFYEGDDFRLRYEKETIQILSSISRKQVCTLIAPAKPAVYDCPSILSDAEEAQIGA